MQAVTRWQRGSLQCRAEHQAGLSRRAALQLAPLAGLALFGQQAQALTPYEEAKKILLGPTKDGCGACRAEGQTRRQKGAL